MCFNFREDGSTGESFVQLHLDCFGPVSTGDYSNPHSEYALKSKKATQASKNNERVNVEVWIKCLTSTYPCGTGKVRMEIWCYLLSALHNWKSFVSCVRGENYNCRLFYIRWNIWIGCFLLLHFTGDSDMITESIVYVTIFVRNLEQGVLGFVECCWATVQIFHWLRDHWSPVLGPCWYFHHTAFHGFPALTWSDMHSTVSAQHNTLSIRSAARTDWPSDQWRSCPEA